VPGVASRAVMAVISMKTPTPTFKAELVSFRQRLAPVIPYTDPDRKREFERKQKMHLAVLDRWLEHPDAEKPWMMLKAKSRELLLPGLFIAEVLQRREVADDLDRRISGQAGLEKQTEARVKELMRRPVRGERLKAAAARQERLDDLARDSTPFGREGLVAARQHFVRELTKRFVSMTGRKLDEAVRILTEVCFGEPETIEMVRRASRRDRSTRPRK
jgi:hypothetical protein